MTSPTLEEAQKKNTDTVARMIGLNPNTMSNEKRAFIDEHFIVCRLGLTKMQDSGN